FQAKPRRPHARLDRVRQGECAACTPRSKDRGPSWPRPRGGYCLSVSFVVSVNVPTAVFADGWAFWLSLHLPLLSLGRSPENRTTALPLPVAPANLPVLLAPSTVSGTVVVSTTRQVVVDLRAPVLVPALSRVTTRLPAAVVNV